MPSVYQNLSADFDAAYGLGRMRFVMSKMVRVLDFEHWHYERADYVHFARPDTMVMGNLPAAWSQHERLLEPDRLSIDSCKKQFRFGYLPPVKIWGMAKLETDDEIAISAPYQGFLVPDDESTSGWSQAIRGNDGDTLGMFSVLRRNQPLTQQEITQKQTHIHWLAQALHEKIAKLNASHIVLTSSEREIMCWTADGKSTAEIASILQIKERTVTFRINNVVNRLGVQNKTAAAVRLAVGGLLF